jgi:hypothetical protein
MIDSDLPPWPYDDADDSENVSGPKKPSAAAGAVRATPFIYRDPSLIPKRQWLYGKHLVRGFASATIAPGGVGKTALKVVEALAMATGRDLLSVGIIPQPLRVWLYNLEDPAEEMERRIAGAMLHYGIRQRHIEGRLFMDSGRDQSLVIAESLPGGSGAKILRPKVDELKAEIMAREIDVLVVDPFVSCHLVNENDNGAIDQVAKEWGGIAHAMNGAVELVHHSKKTNGQAVTAESSRGAVALISAARSVVTLNPMTEAEGDGMGLEAGERARLFRADSGKANLAPPGTKAEWYRLASIDLGNGDGLGDGDNIGVVARFYPPSILQGIEPAHIEAIKDALRDGQGRQSNQSPDWAGNVIATTLDRDPTDPGTRKQMGRLISKLVKDGHLREKTAPDKRSKLVPFLVPV